MSGEDKHSDAQVLILTRTVVCAFVRNNPVPADQFAEFVKEIAGSFAQIIDPPEEAEPARRKPNAAQIRASIRDMELISFEDGEAYALLRKHLRHRGLTPSAYRMKWGLPLDYPMIAPFYTRKRANLVQGQELGHHKRGKAALAAKNENRPPPDEGGRLRQGGPAKGTPKTNKE